VVTIWADGVDMPASEQNDMVRYQCAFICTTAAVITHHRLTFTLQPKRDYTWRTHAEFVALHEQLPRVEGASSMQLRLPSATWLVRTSNPCSLGCTERNYRRSFLQVPQHKIGPDRYC
jgi:hypothetical protein